MRRGSAKDTRAKQAEAKRTDPRLVSFARLLARDLADRSGRSWTSVAARPILKASSAAIPMDKAEAMEIVRSQIERITLTAE